MIFKLCTPKIFDYFQNKLIGQYLMTTIIEYICNIFF